MSREVVAGEDKRVMLLRSYWTLQAFIENLASTQKEMGSQWKDLRRVVDHV